MILNIKSLFIAEQDRVLIEADKAQADARVVAYEAGDPIWIKAFETKQDIHMLNAMDIFEVAENKITKKMRDLGKKIVHATDYGMGARTLVESIIKELGIEYVIKESEARAFQKRFFQKHPWIQEWQARIREHLKIDRMMVNALGRKRIFMAPWGEALFKEAYAWSPASTVADDLNRSLLEWDELYGSEKPILHQCHDSVLISWKKCDIIDYKLMREVFEKPLIINGNEIRIPIEFKVGESWGSMKEIK